MPENPNQPREYDAVLGGEALLKGGSAVLGGVEGLRQGFTTGNPAQRIEILANALNYQDAGLELLIQALNDPVLTVRATAYNYLLEIDSEQAQQAIANGILINQGDRIYSVYESAIGYNDWCYDLLISLEDIESYCGSTSIRLISRHVFQASAEAAALSHHNWKAFQDDVCHYLPYIGWDESDGLRDSFNIIEFCRNNNVLIRLPGESRGEFDQRLQTSGYTVSDSSKLAEEHQHIYEELLKKELDVEDGWNIRYELEQRTIKSLQASQRYELLGQLWLESVGMLAFIHEEIIEEKTYLIVKGKL